MSRTDRSTVEVAAPGASGWQALSAGPGEPHRSRTDLAPVPEALGEVLLSVAHLSDLHVCDAQSPARVEYLDRWADPDSPILDVVGEVGTYRAQDMLTAQVVEAAVRAVNGVAAGPVGGAALDLAVVTGDNTDNSQSNELDWYLTLLEGGVVCPDSGAPDRWEGVASFGDERYWHPGGAPPDLPRSRFGFPSVPGLLDAIRAPFTATGLDVPWLAVHGNHDRMLQGTVPGRGLLAAAAVGSEKLVGLPPELTPAAVAELLAGLADCDTDALATLHGGERLLVTPDPRRRLYSVADFLAAHRRPGARPPGHGFTGEQTYHRHDHGPVSVLVLDTVNGNGGWQGSLDAGQLDWLSAELDAAEADRRYVVLASHHPLATLVNGRRPGPAAADGDRRILGEELASLLAAHPSVVLWLNGHTHTATVTPRDGYWEVTTPSLIDWPQQSRVVELLRGAGVLTIATTMLDHDGPIVPVDAPVSPVDVAGLSRALAANDWQGVHGRRGTAADRNVLLHLPDPWA